MARKRSSHELDVESPTPSTSIHRALVTLTASEEKMKTSLTACWLMKHLLLGIGQRKLNEYHQKNIAVQLEDCEVKAASQGGGLRSDP